MSTLTFYSDLPVVTEFEAVTRAESYAEMPDDWHLALCDVRNSTAAVANGKYRNVNSIGAAAITAILNAAGRIEVPFSFEGDGSLVFVPDALLADTRAALALARDMARDAFGLDLRIATVPVADLRAAGCSVRVARYRVSENYVQAVFTGGGIARADELIKRPDADSRYLIAPGSVAPRGSFDGFECRWEDVPSRHGETVSLMVLAPGADAARAAATYREVIRKVRELYGNDEACHPVAVPELAMTLKSDLLADEVGVQTGRTSGLRRWLRLMRTRAIVLLGKFLMRFGIRTQDTDWSGYKETLARNTDVRKFTDVYRQILSGTAAQRSALDAWLQSKFKSGELVYGLHVANRAHMTCLVFDYAGRHLHFIDGADGGLFLAAKAFKERAKLRADRVTA